MKYVILADSSNPDYFVIPRQLSIVKDEPLLHRTIRLLSQNGIKDIIVSSHDSRMDDDRATRYEPKFNYYDAQKGEGYWLNGFPRELLIEPITFLFGDVYYSENAIKTIIETETDSVLFFCTYQNQNPKYFKHHDEPLAFKVKDYELFLKHIDIMKSMYDRGKTCRHPIAWELYRSINGQDINVHEMTTNYVAINDESCDVDCLEDIEKLNEV